MRISSTSRPRSTTVTAYLDGTANMIQPPVLRGHGQLQAAAERYQHLDVDVTGQRLDQKKELQSAATYFAGAGAVAALGTAVGRAFGTEVGLCVGLFAAPPLLIAARHVQTAFTERSFHPGAPCAQSAQADRLLETLTQQSARNPGARKVAYFSGHGSHRTIAGFDPQTLGKVLRQSPVDLTVLDACTTAQIEVLSQMAPQAGLVLSLIHI